MRPARIAQTQRSLFAALVRLTCALCLLSGAADALAQGATGQTTPVTTVPTSQRNQTEYEVKAGDTLSGIAARFDTTVEEIMALNGLANRSTLSLGQVLRIPGTAATASPAISPTAETLPAEVPSSAAIPGSPESPAAETLPPSFAPEPPVIPSGVREPVRQQPAVAVSPPVANPPVSANPAPSGISLPSLPTLLALVLLLPLGGKVLFEMRRARRKGSMEGRTKTGPES